MCKHKSGGMAKPSGAGSQDGNSERTTSASVTSHDCPEASSEIASSQQLNSMAPNLDPGYNSHARDYVVAPNLRMHPQTSSRSCDTYSFLPNDRSEYNLEQNMSFIPNIPESQHGYAESIDSDDDTEQSPMLVNEVCSGYYDPSSQLWDPSMNQDLRYNGNMSEMVEYNSRDLNSCSVSEGREKATNCDNFPLYHNFQSLNLFQQPVSFIPAPYPESMQCCGYFDNTNNFEDTQPPALRESNYLSKPKKKWLLNQKCKSADSEPDPCDGGITSVCKRGLFPPSYNYIQNQSTNILGAHDNGCNSYSKPLFLSNGDPIAGPSGLQRPSSINWDTGASNLDSEFRSRSYSLTPTVNFAVFESESSSDAEDAQDPMVPKINDVPNIIEPKTKAIDDPFELPDITLGKVIPMSPSAAQLSIASSYGDNGSPICKICHMTARENDPLISPCRCSGTMQYIHCGCLMRWLEVCHKRGRRPASCELCQYQYHWHKKFKIRHWQFPRCSRKDKILHLLFIFSVLLMVACASLTVLFFKHDKGTKVDLERTELTHSEIGNLVCGVLFFVAFFVAIYVEAKSHDTLYQLLVKFIHINQQWYIDEYEKKETAPVAV
ncbi:uncharacterized protein [Parasteatoda tepidariorum]|uniref:E3 ubiquitin-protein ligase MARCH1 n=1 Tax=Parasteatoda tepidariorum TaxID=114398 RepID=A0A2L2Y8Y2_PARTP|nr:uncharacterized protein LOC107439095 [Parasteatoda tepidariorum]XP_015907162.1 uncharacterized protein LOC107439095 [Parasteatoda tepidariorum]